MLDDLLGIALGDVIMRIVAFILSRIGAAVLWLLRFGTRPYKQYLNTNTYGAIPHLVGFAFLFGVFIAIMFYIN